MFRICAKPQVNNAVMFLLLLSRAHTEPRPFQLFVLPQRVSEEVGDAWEIVTRHSQDRWPHLTKGIFQTLSLDAQSVKLGGGRRKGRAFQVMAFIFPSKHYSDQALLSQRWLNTCLPVGSGQLILCFKLVFLCVRAAFAFPIKLPTCEFSCFPYFDSLPQSHWWRNEQVPVWFLVASTTNGRVPSVLQASSLLICKDKYVFPIPVEHIIVY